jgi:flagellar hook-associated protein 2
MGISSAGIGSGLDVNAIVTSLMAVESKPLTTIANHKAAYQAKISAYGTLKSALSTFQATVSSLSSASQFDAKAATSGNPAVFTATAAGSATIGSHAVTVSQLAQSEKVASTGFANTTDIVGTGTLTIAFGTYAAAGNTFTANAAKANVTVSITAANNTLSGVRDAINASNSSVSATIVNNGTTNQLVITSKDTGEVNSLKITVADGDGTNFDTLGLSQLAYDPTAAVGAGKNMTETQVAKNALLSVDGIALVKASNTISDAVAGVTLNLLATSAGGSVNLDIANNQVKVTASVTAFVDAYNKLDTTLRSLTKYDPTGKASGALLGDATARTITNQIKSVLTQSIPNGGTITSLGQIGVSLQSTGQLAVDSTKLAAALTNNFNGVAALFAATATATDPQITYAGSTSATKNGTYAVTVSQLVPAAGTINGVAATGIGTNLVGAAGDPSAGLNLNVSGGALGARGTVTFSRGYAAQLNDLVNSQLSATGLLSARTDGVNSSIAGLDKQTASFNYRLTAIEARYRAQFTKLDTLLSSMSTTSTFLTQQIAAINANS